MVAVGRSFAVVELVGNHLPEEVAEIGRIVAEEEPVENCPAVAGCQTVAAAPVVDRIGHTVAVAGNLRRRKGQ